MLPKNQETPNPAVIHRNLLNLAAKGRDQGRMMGFQTGMLFNGQTRLFAECIAGWAELRASQSKPYQAVVDALIEEIAGFVVELAA